MSNPRSPLEQLSACVLSTEQIRQVDRRAIAAYGMHSLVLMENAALGCVAWIRGRIGSMPFSGQSYPKTVILCGAGNNGGDGLVIARHLRTLGWQCDVFALGPVEKLSDDARANAQILTTGDAAGIVWYPGEGADEQLQAALAEAELIIDAMLGTGSQAAPRPPFEDWIQQANRSAGFRLAIDIPTGVDAMTGSRAASAFAADATLTFVARKPAMANPQTKGFFGQVSVLPIGIPLGLIQEIIQEIIHEARG